MLSNELLMDHGSRLVQPKYCLMRVDNITARRPMTVPNPNMKNTANTVSTQYLFSNIKMFHWQQNIIDVQSCESIMMTNH